MNKKNTILITYILVFSILFTGCSNIKKDENNTLTTAITSNPRSFDPAYAISQIDSNILNYLYTGLLTYDESGKLTEGMSEFPKISEDGLKYTFKIKDDMKWSNGDNVTAYDFENEWLRILNPEIKSKYSYQLYYIKGAEEYNKIEKPGKTYIKDVYGNNTDLIESEITYSEKDLEGIDKEGKSEEELNNLVYEKWLKEKKKNVGIFAKDEKTLMVELVNPVPYFSELTAFFTLYPTNKKVIENKDWAKSPESLVTNGAFKLKEYKKDEYIIIEKNNDWFNSEKVKLNNINFEIVEDVNTIWKNYEDDKYQIIYNAPEEVITKKLKEEDKELKIEKEIGTTYIQLNTENKDNNPFSNKNIRNALSYSLNRNELVKNFASAGKYVATGIVPYGLSDENDEDFRMSKGNLLEYNIEKSKELLNKGLEETSLSVDDLNKQVLLYSKNNGFDKLANEIVRTWNENLGLNIQVQAEEYNDVISKTYNDDFGINLTTWTGDYLDPMTMLDIFLSDSKMNNPNYENKDYDRYILDAKKSSFESIRMKSMKKAEEILLQDKPIIPIYFETLSYFVKDNVKQVSKPNMEKPNLTYAYFE